MNQDCLTAWIQHKPSPDYWRALLLTIGLIVLYRTGSLIPCPFVNEAALHQRYAIVGNARFSIFSLGLMPYMSAYVLVEVASLFVPPLKRWRRQGHSGRQKIRRMALWLTFPLAVYQATSLLSAWNQMAGPEAPLVRISHPELAYAVMAATLVTAVFMLVRISDLISGWGIGHGIAVLVLTDLCARFFSSLMRNLRMFGEMPLALLITLASLLLLIIPAVILLRQRVPVIFGHARDNFGRQNFELNLCPSGTTPLIWAASLTMLPAMLGQFMDWDPAHRVAWQPGSAGYTLCMLALVIGFSYLWAISFLHSRRRLARMAKQGWTQSRTGPSLPRRAVICNIPWTAYLCLLAILPTVLVTWFNVPFYIGGSASPIFVAIILDLLNGYHFASGSAGRKMKIAELQDVYEAMHMKNHLAANDIAAHLQGFHFRLLLYFFGPYIEMGLWVPEAHKDHAARLLKEFFGSPEFSEGI